LTPGRVAEELIYGKDKVTTGAQVLFFVFASWSIYKMGTVLKFFVVRLAEKVQGLEGYFKSNGQMQFHV
jgi:hypothetical protein